MRTPNKPSPLFAALAAVVAVVGCCSKPPCDPSSGRDCPPASDGGACPAIAAALAGAGTEACSPAQRVCLVAGDLPATVARPDFVPASTFARYQANVTLWRAEAARIGALPALAADAQVLVDRLDLATSDEKVRKAIVESRDLQRDLRALAVSADREVGPLPCPLPPEP